MSRAGHPSLRSIPSVDRILRELGVLDLPRAAVLAVVRREVAQWRKDHVSGAVTRSGVDLMDHIRDRIATLRRARLQTVINATGIIIHTNFGRAPLGSATVDLLTQVASRYNNLEFDLGTGERGSRAAYVEHNLAVLCHAQCATVVNNCAAALVLILRYFTRTPERTEIVIGRGELVQIGGGFRIPEILETSGATLREVGTTNKTTIEDYEKAVTDRTAMILKVHQSNFYMGGFVESPAPDLLAKLSRGAGVPFVVDLGSGAVFDTASVLNSEPEPTPAQAVEQGADLVAFSGDKLLGGPQAGVIAGRADLVADLKKDPLFRALRCDKLILGALQTTVDLLLDSRESEIPIRQMMQASTQSLRARARTIMNALQVSTVDVSVDESEAQVGGGSLPRAKIPSICIDLPLKIIPAGSETEVNLPDALRSAMPPIIGYVTGNRLRLDLRTVFADQDDALIQSLRRVFIGPR